MKYIVITILMLLSTMAVFAQDPDTKHTIGGGLSYVREDVTAQSIKNPNLHFNETTDMLGVELHGSHFFGKDGGGPCGFNVKFVVNQGKGRKLRAGTFGAICQYRKGPLRPFASAGVGASSQNDFVKSPIALTVDQRGVGVAYHVSAGLETKVSKHVSLRLLEVGVLGTNYGKGGDSAGRTNFFANSGITWHW